MLTLLLFCTPLVLTCILAVVRGGRDERIGAASFVIAFIATIIADRQTAGIVAQPEWAVAMVDAVLAVPLLYLALCSDRFWPMWALGFHMVTLMTHLAVWVQPEILSEAYAISIGFLAYPTMGALLVALLVRRRPGFDAAWPETEPSRAN